MADYQTLTVEQALQGIRETKAAIKRADELIEKVSAAGIKKPSVFGAMAESTAKLREHLTADLDALEKALDAQLKA